MLVQIHGVTRTSDLHGIDLKCLTAAPTQVEEAPSLVAGLALVIIQIRGLGLSADTSTKPDDDQDASEEMVFMGLEKALMSLRYLAAAGARETLASEGIWERETIRR